MSHNELLLSLAYTLLYVFLKEIIWQEAGEPEILISHGFLNPWYFTGSISSPGSSFIGLIGASSGKTVGGSAVRGAQRGFV